MLELCRRLDGLPLALELAAARMATLGPTELVTRLDSRLELLTGGSRTAAERQRTLRGAIAWSYDLLNEGEQKAFRQVSIFAGRFSLATAGAVIRPCIDEAGSTRTTVLDLISRLVEKSLLVLDEDGATYYRLLETLRGFGREQLLIHREEPEAAARHARHYLQLAETADVQMWETSQEEWLRRLDGERADLFAALDWSCSPAGDVDTGLRLIGALWWYFYVRGSLSAGRQWVDRLLMRPVAERPTVGRARALLCKAHLAFYQGDPEIAKSCGEEGLAIARELGDGEAVTLALAIRGGLVLPAAGEYLLAEALIEESLARQRASGSAAGVPGQLNHLGNIARGQGRTGEARSFYQQALIAYRELDSRFGVALELDHLGLLAYEEGDFDEAAELLTEGLKLFRYLGDRWDLARSLLHLGRVVVAQGDLAGARLHYRESLALAEELEDSRSVALLEAALESLERVEPQSDRVEGPPEEQRSPERLPNTLARASIDFGMRQLSVRVATNDAGLTPRELEVLALNAHGRTNKEIALTLVVSVRTAARHIATVYKKIGAHSRAEATLYAMKNHLL
ncbi:MAG: ATP-binding protein [Dehalococcoidia bacterium]